MYSLLAQPEVLDSVCVDGDESEGQHRHREDKMHPRLAHHRLVVDAVVSRYEVAKDYRREVHQKHRHLYDDIFLQCPILLEQALGRLEDHHQAPHAEEGHQDPDVVEDVKVALVQRVRHRYERAHYGVLTQQETCHAEVRQVKMPFSGEHVPAHERGHLVDPERRLLAQQVQRPLRAAHELHEQLKKPEETRHVVQVRQQLQ
mmetsp:Transcript_17764/g.42682  ORF Transcript_17764/g.42682 Transcript_17764/m.42682 type:complete len:202 (+) Transcript_17764:2340-2945(+)